MTDAAGSSSNEPAVELGAGHVVERGASAQQRAAPDGDVKLTMHGESTLYDELVDEHEHFSHRAPTLRAAVLGANDGLVSVAALMVGVGGGSSDITTMRLAGLAGLVGGALSMACGEYISVSSQRDSEEADVEKERIEQLKGPRARAHELEELAQIYEDRGISKELARQVAVELTNKDVIRAHARDELGIDIDDMSNAVTASVASMIAFLVGGALPFLAGAFIKDPVSRMGSILAVSTVGLGVFGYLGAAAGGAPVLRATIRVLIGGWIAMGITYGIGRAFGASGAA